MPGDLRSAAADISSGTIAGVSYGAVAGTNQLGDAVGDLSSQATRWDYLTGGAETLAPAPPR